MPRIKRTRIEEGATKQSLSHFGDYDATGLQSSNTLCLDSGELVKAKALPAELSQGTNGC